MNLSDLLRFEHVAIQCHDNPDADAIAAGFGLYSYFTARGIKAVLFYGGRAPVTKPNLVKMLTLCDIPLEHHPQSRDWPGLLITVDCQYGAGNVSPMRGAEVAVIDHHIQECAMPPLHDIRPYLGACSTLVWLLMQEAGFCLEEIGAERGTALLTALYYGLYTDTGGFSEVRHPLDRDLRDQDGIVERIIKTLRSSNLSLEDLSIASSALAELSFDPQGGFALVGVRYCDPNLLGFISDLVLQVDTVDIAVVYCETPGGIKYSVRSITWDCKASDLAAWFAADGLGSGGGHAEKAGGWISGRNLAEHMPNLSAADYFNRRLREYRAAYVIIDHATAPHVEDMLPEASRARRYTKRPLRLAYVPAEKLPRGSELHIRMLEGDISLASRPDTYLMIGLLGEVYPISRAVFDSAYRPLDAPLQLSLPYTPSVLDKTTGIRLPLDNIARPCMRLGGGVVHAALLTKGVKVFTRWDADNYLKGEKGDWLVWPEEDPTDIYIITAPLFPLLYAGENTEGNAEADDGGEVLNCAGLDVAAQPGAVRARKKPVIVTVRFARQAGVSATREGPVPYAIGDALITGSSGETWPVQPAHFSAAYTPLAPTQAGQEGSYQALPIEVDALRMSAHFYLSLKNGGLLWGPRGDWLVQYGDGEHGIIGALLFASIYEILRIPEKS
ncbi:MAG: DHH family phosphoesterase [Betaproteobacteria bacterium]|nr:DHH family phosphoesterase [Betaproteobacteria bacterium]